MSNIDIGFQPDGQNEVNFDPGMLTAFRLAIWLRAGSLAIRFQLLLEERQDYDDTAGPGRPEANSTLIGGGALPVIGSGTINWAQGKSTLTLRGISIRQSPERRLSGEGYAATLITFGPANAWTNNKHDDEHPRLQASCETTTTLGSLKGLSGGMFQWKEPESFPLTPDEAREGLVPSEAVGEVAKPLRGDLETSGTVVSFRTARTQTNDPIPMLLRQLASNTICLDISYLYNPHSEASTLNLRQVQDGHGIQAILYEQVWGRFREERRCWTPREIRTHSATPDQLLRLGLDDVLPRGAKYLPGEAFSADPAIEERMTFLFDDAHGGVNWPQLPIVARDQSSGEGAAGRARQGNAAE